MVTLTKGSTVITPTLVQGFEATAPARTVVHELLENPAPAVTLKDSGRRTGTLNLFFNNVIDAEACAAAHRRAGVWVLDSTYPAASTLTNLIMNPRPGSTSGWTFARSTGALVDGRIRQTVTANDGTVNGYQARIGQTGANLRYAVSPGDTVAARIRVRNPMSKAIRVRLYVPGYQWNGTTWVGAPLPYAADTGTVTLAPGETRILESVGTQPANITTHVLPLFVILGATTTVPAVGDYVDWDEFALFTGPTAPTTLPVPFFSGNSENYVQDGYSYITTWQGTPNASASFGTKTPLPGVPGGTLRYVVSGDVRISSATDEGSEWVVTVGFQEVDA